MGEIKDNEKARGKELGPALPAIQRYKIGYHSDEWGVRSLSPSGIYDDAGPWVRYKDHVAVITALRAQQPSPSGEESKPHGWLYDWTHSSATGKPDTTYTGFTKDEAHARKHDNCTAIYTSPQPAPQQEAQEPAAVVVPCHTPSGERVALYSAKQDLPIGTQLYTAHQPSPAAQGDK